jgi:bifunctional non-homologous end joining protein LigD
MPQKNLKKYREMRDFSKTAEPSGSRGAKAAKSPRRRFVVQKHAATRLHYDFRLELDGTFKSWAVTKGPSNDPADKRLAVEVEDHPLEYGDFEGTIPKGEYGGGTVQLWDRGYWEPEGDLSPEDALKKGDFKFTLEGERLHGSWVLVRMKWNRDRDKNSKRTNWLLIKHRDKYAHEGGAEHLMDVDKSVASGRTMKAIAEGKGKGPKPFMLKGAKALRIPAAAVWDTSGRHDKTVKPPKDAAQPAPKTKSALPEFIEPQLTHLVDRPPNGENWVHEVKFDGYRLQLRVEGGETQLRTRKGLDWTEKFPEIAEIATRLPDGIYDGEVCAVDKSGAPDFSALQAALSDGKTEKLIFFAFDLLFAEGKDLRRESLLARKMHLKNAVETLRKSDRDTIRYVDHLTTGGEALLESAGKMGLEGIVSKETSAPYRSGRGHGWVKAKVRAGQEVVIGAWWGDATNLRSLFVGVRKGDKLVYAGKVGTGYSAAKAKRVLPHLKKLKTDESPFIGPNAPKRGAGIHWVKPELVAEVEFAGWTSDGMVRQAAFKDLRLDKPAKDVKAEAAADPEEVEMPAPKAKAKSKAASKSGGSAKPEILGVTISNPQKAMWPDAGDRKPVNKLDLAQYYEEIGDWMLPHIKGIPCSVVRAPDGFAKEQFFQRHSMLGMSKALNEIKVSGDRKPYLVINSVEGLIAVAQIAGLELHPWNCLPDKPDVPGRLVFDLDPAPDVEFSEVIAAAKLMKDWLELLGLAAFCKTTGGKGLHVVTPLAPGKDKLTWPQAKDFCRDLCERIAADAPDRFLVNMSKAKRTGKIFLDYLRNDRMSTAVGPLSPRARPGATVSMPLTWAQVKAGLDPKKFTIRTAPALLKKSKAWSDYAKSAKPLLPAIKRLAGSPSQ